MSLNNLLNLTLDKYNNLDCYDLVCLEKEYRKLSSRHVACFELYTTKDELKQVVKVMENLRLANNELVAIIRNRIIQMRKTKRFKKYISRYRSTSDKSIKSYYAEQLNDLYADYGLTKRDCEIVMQSIYKKFSLYSVFALTRADAVWKGVEKCLFSNGDLPHFTTKDNFPCLEAKTPDRGISIQAYTWGSHPRYKDNTGSLLVFKLAKSNLIFSVDTEKLDRFLLDENDAICNYLKQPTIVTDKAIKETIFSGKLVSRYRPCYASLVLKKIRGKYRLYAHVTIEGDAFPKYNKYGELRHIFANKGKVGVDIGTQTIAVTSDTNCILKNLAVPFGL